MVFSEFWRGFGGGKTPHREQARYIAAVDAGLHEALLHWAKKSAKSFTAAMRALHYLVAEERDPDDRLIGIASYDEEQSRIIFSQAAQVVSRHAWLSEHVRVLKTEMVFEEDCVEPRTGGTYTKSHRIRVLARDSKGLHGEPWSLVLRDELWNEPNHDMTEALIPSPARPWSEILYTSYSTLATMRKAGVPFHDLMTRVKAGDPSLFYSFIGGSGEDASWNVCPWIQPAWIEQQRRLFAASPSRFKRVVLNEETRGDGDTLLTVAEIAAAQVAGLRRSGRLDGLGSRIASLDLATTNDHAAYVDGGLDPRGRFVVAMVKVWKPAPGTPINFAEIEEFVIDRWRTAPFGHMNVDQWNAHYLVARLVTAGVPARVVGVEQTVLDRIITKIKDTFSRRAIMIDAAEVYLFEQLEALKTLETRSPRRDMLKFAPSGTGPDASQHDDAAVSLGLCLIDATVKDRIGRITMAPIAHCNLASSGHINSVAACFLAGGAFVPTGHTVCVRDCAAFRSTREAMADFETNGGESMGLREFVASGHIAPCTFVRDAKVDDWFRNYR